ncbi:hypothetical protein ACVWYH_006838 [Bradyrhizobium sp. GM24.11]
MPLAPESLTTAAGLRGDDAGILQIQLRLIELRLRLLELCLGTFELGLQRLDADLRRCHRGLGALGVGLLGLKIGARLLLALHGAGALFDQIFRAIELFLRELKLGLRLVELRLGLLDLLLLGDDLRLDIGDVGLGDLDLRRGLIDGDAIVALVDPGEEIARLDVLVIRDRDISHVAADFRGHGKAARRDEGVVGGFIVADLEPIEQTAGQRRDQHDGTDGCEQPVLGKTLAQRRRRLLRLVLGFAGQIRRSLWSFLRPLRLLRGRLTLPCLSIHDEYLSRHEIGSRVARAGTRAASPTAAPKHGSGFRRAPLLFVIALPKKEARHLTCHAHVNRRT